YHRSTRVHHHTGALHVVETLERSTRHAAGDGEGFRRGTCGQGVRTRSKELWTWFQWVAAEQLMILGSHRIEKVTGSDGSPLIGVLYARAHTRTRDDVYNRQPVTTRHVSRISKAAPGGIRQNPREIWVAAPADLEIFFPHHFGFSKKEFLKSGHCAVRGTRVKPHATRLNLESSARKWTANPVHSNSANTAAPASKDSEVLTAP